MKKKWIASLVAAGLALTAIVTGCTKKTPENNGGGETTGSTTETTTTYVPADPLAFEYLEISESGDMAMEDIIRVEKQGDGIRLAHIYNMMGPENEEVLIREIIGGPELLQEISQLLGDAGVENWDGFNESDPDVCDGYGFSMTCRLTDGRTLSASGSNAFPENFGVVWNDLRDRLSYYEVSGTKFTSNYYECELPEDWAGLVTANFDYDHNAFWLTRSDNTKVYLIRMDFNFYEEEAADDRIIVGKLVSDDGEDELYLSIYLYNSYLKEDDASEAQYAIYQRIREDALTIADSMMGINGYTLIPAN